MARGIAGRDVISKIKRDNIKRGDIFIINERRVIKKVNESNHIQEGRRPVIVVSNDICNEKSRVIEVVPLTSQIKNPLPTHVTIKAIYESTALCEQIRSINKYQLSRYIRTATNEEMKFIDEALKISLGLGESKDEDNRNN